MRRLVIMALVVVAVSIVACGGDDSATTVTGRAPTAPGGKTAKIPDVVGERLNKAERELRDLGLAYQATSTRSSDVSRSPNWEVCKTNPPAGFVMPTEARIEVVVDRPGECPSRP